MFYGMSIVSGEVVAKVLGEQARGLAIAQVVPLPESSVEPDTQDLPAHAATGDAEPSYYSFEGWLNAQVMIEGLRRTGRELTRARLLAAMRRVEDAPGQHGPRLHRQRHCCLALRRAGAGALRRQVRPAEAGQARPTPQSRSAYWKRPQRRTRGTQPRSGANPATVSAVAGRLPGRVTRPEQSDPNAACERRWPVSLRGLSPAPSDEGPVPRSKRTYAWRSVERLLSALAVVQLNVPERPRSVCSGPSRVDLKRQHMADCRYR